MSELRRTLRSLARRPAFTGISVLTLALGIGANTTVFSLVSAVHLRPLPFPESNRLVGLHETSATKLCAGCSVGTSYPGFLDWRAAARSFEGMAAYSELEGVIAGDGQPTRVGVGAVSGDFFAVLRAPAARGRTISPADDRLGSERVAVLSHWLWQSRYAADPNIMGRTIRVNGTLHEVIGVMPDWVRIPEFADLWVALEPTVETVSRAVRDYGVVARLGPGVTAEAADAEVQNLAAGLARAYPEDQSEWSAKVSSLRDDLGGDTGPFFWLLLGAVGLVLLVACASLSGLLLARAAARDRELAVRAALGASRSGLARHLLTEALILGAVGGGVGLLLSLWGVDLVRALLPQQIPHWIQVQLDGRVLAFCAAVTLGTALGFGVLPALRYSRPDLVESLKESSATLSGGRRQGLRSALVVFETALAIVLLCGAGLLGKTYLRMTAGPARAGADDVVLADLRFTHQRYRSDVEVSRAVEAILERLTAVPGRQVAAGRFVFVAGFGAQDQRIAVEGIAEVPAAASPRFIWTVTPAYFAVQQLPIIAGRGLTNADGAGAAAVVVVNRHMAEVLWPGESGLGRQVRLGGTDSGEPWRTVVGVVTSDEQPRPGSPPQANAYIPLAQSAGTSAAARGSVQLMIQSQESLGGVAGAIRNAVAEVDPEEPIENVRTAAQDRRQVFWFIGFFATLLGSFAGFAVLLAATGLYGIVAYQVVERRREIGLRTALGARRPQVLRAMIGRGLRLSAAGVLAGLALSAMLTRLMGSMLFGTSPVDPWVLGAVALTLMAVTLLASLIPAWRATAVDPMEALRHE